MEREERFQRAAKALWLWFIAASMDMVCARLTVKSILMAGQDIVTGWNVAQVVRIAALVISLCVAWYAREAHPHFRRAFWSYAVYAILYVCDLVCPPSHDFETVIMLTYTVADSLKDYFICAAAAALLREKGCEKRAGFAGVVWVLSAVRAAVFLTAMVLVFVSQNEILAWLGLFMAIAALIAAQGISLLRMILYFVAATSLKAA